MAFSELKFHGEGLIKQAYLSWRALSGRPSATEIRHRPLETVVFLAGSTRRFGERRVHERPLQAQFFLQKRLLLGHGESGSQKLPLRFIEAAAERNPAQSANGALDGIGRELLFFVHEDRR